VHVVGSHRRAREDHRVGALDHEGADKLNSISNVSSQRRSSSQSGNVTQVAAPSAARPTTSISTTSSPTHAGLLPSRGERSAAVRTAQPSEARLDRVTLRGRAAPTAEGAVCVRR
jgi:hypothetical protein